jgi:enoyl-CoA hydratase/carnithine racemase
MPRVLYERDGRIARLTLNRPEALNAIDAELPGELEAAVARANAAGRERDLGTYDWTADRKMNPR